MGNVWGPELAYHMCIAYFILHNNKPLFRKKTGVWNFLLHIGGGMCFGPKPPRGWVTKKR